MQRCSPGEYSYEDNVILIGTDNVAKMDDSEFLHATPWIPVVEKSIHSALRQFEGARTVDEYDVIIPVFLIHVTLQVNCGDVTMLRKERPRWQLRNPAIDDSFERLCIHGLKSRVKNKRMYCVTVNNDICQAFRQWFSLVKICWIASLVTKSLFMVTHILFYISYFIGYTVCQQSEKSPRHTISICSHGIQDGAGRKLPKVLVDFWGPKME